MYKIKPSDMAELDTLIQGADAIQSWIDEEMRMRIRSELERTRTLTTLCILVKGSMDDAWPEKRFMR